DAEVVFADGGIYVIGQFGADLEDSISEAHLYYGVLNGDGTVTYIGEKPAQVSSDGSGVARAFYNLGFLTIYDGEDATAAYLALSQDSTAGTATISVPLTYYAPGADGIEALLAL